MENKTHSIRQIGIITAVAVIIANMIGTGVYTSLGYQILGFSFANAQSYSALIMLWVVGGVVALCGALCYAELAVRFPGSGGEYNYLSKIYHPALGFLSGWVSATVGFAAPIAAAAIAFSDYSFTMFPALAEIPFAKKIIGSLVILTLAFINSLGVKTTSGFQRIITYANIIFIVLFIILGISFASSAHFNFTLKEIDWKAMLSSSFAVSLVYVSLAYSGWNSVTYLAGEVKNPEKSIPRASILATFTVMVLYVLLNLTFLLSTPMDSFLIKDAQGNITDAKSEAGLVAAQAIFGVETGKWIGLIIAIGLLATINSMTISGPRVTNQIGEDFRFFRKFTERNAGGSPLLSIFFQTGMALILVITATFPAIIIYIGFTLTLFTTLTVAGLMIARFRKPPEAGLYKTPLFPLVPIIFIALEVYSIIYTLKDKPVPSLIGLGTALLGLLVYFLAENFEKNALNLLNTKTQ